MTKELLTKRLVNQHGLPYVQSRTIVNDLVDTIADQIKKNGRFVISGFGTFMLAEMPAALMRNPRTGETIKVRARKTVRFKVSPALRQGLAPKRRGRKQG